MTPRPPRASALLISYILDENDGGGWVAVRAKEYGAGAVGSVAG